MSHLRVPEKISIHASDVHEAQVFFGPNRSLFLLSSPSGFVLDNESTLYAQYVMNTIEETAELYCSTEPALSKFLAPQSGRRLDVTAINTGRNPDGSLTVDDRLYAAIPGTSYGVVLRRISDIRGLTVHKD